MAQFVPSIYFLLLFFKLNFLFYSIVSRNCCRKKVFFQNNINFTALNIIKKIELQISQFDLSYEFHAHSRDIIDLVERSETGWKRHAEVKIVSLKIDPYDV